MVAGGKLRDYAPVGGVQFDLGMERLGEEPVAGVVEGDTGLVATGFDAEDEQDRGAKS